jgi:RimJ/RimL family protein N-acetyltransferase
MSEIETPRLRLRRWRPADLEALVRWYSNPEIMRHLGMGLLGREESARSLESAMAHWEEHGFGQWAVEEKETGELIGRAGPSYHRLWPDDPEVGWLIDTPWHGRGLATEAGAASLRFVFETLGSPRAVSICIEENVASRRVMEKLGFRFHRELDDPKTGLRLWIHALDHPGKIWPRPPDTAGPHGR